MNIKKLSPGDTVGIFTPSTPAYCFCREKFDLGIDQIKRAGFQVILGDLSKNSQSQGYRSGTPKERADEFMSLYRNPEVKALVATIGGSNSSSMIDYLDFDYIKKNPKIVVGFSDVTSLQIALLKYANLPSFYGPAVMTGWSDFPNGEESTINSFLTATMDVENYPRELISFKQWSNHFRDWGNGDWKKLPREWNQSTGYEILNEGIVNGEIIVANLNTFASCVGTPYFPDLTDKILLLESMDAPLSAEERNLRHLKHAGVFKKIKGLIIGRPEKFNHQGAPFSLHDLYMEIIGDELTFPVVGSVDISHTLPMHTLRQLSEIELKVTKDEASITVLKPMVTP